MSTERALPQAVRPVTVLMDIRNRHLAEWRFLPLILIVTVYPKICNVIVIGIASPPLRGCDEPPAV